MATINIDQIQSARSLISKTFGVIGWKDFGQKNGLLLTNTNSVHTFFVRFPLELVYLDSNMIVLRISKLKPFRISPIVWQTKFILEMPAGSVAKYNLRLKDKINLV